MISSSNRKVHKDFFALLINLPFLWKNWPIRIIQTWKSSKKTRILLGNRCFLRFLTNIYWISQKVHQGKTYSFGKSGPHAKIQKFLSEGFWDIEKMSTRSYMVVFYPKPGLKGPYPRPGPCQNPKRLTTQSPLQPCGKFLDILVERVARATLTNVDTFIDGLIDAPGLRPARDFRYGETRSCNS